MLAIKVVGLEKRLFLWKGELTKGSSVLSYIATLHFVYTTRHNTYTTLSFMQTTLYAYYVPCVVTEHICSVKGEPKGKPKEEPKRGPKREPKGEPKGEPQVEPVHLSIPEQT